jgi:hypothetical protein
MQSFYSTVAGWIRAVDTYHLISTGDAYEALYVETTGDGGLVVNRFLQDIGTKSSALQWILTITITLT